MKRRGTYYAFTLLETLIVLTMIAILVSILLPVFARAREKERQVVCVSNLKQIGAAVAMYRVDYDNLYPYAADPLTQKYQPGLWQSADFSAIYSSLPTIPTVLQPYIRNREIFRCPSDHGGKVIGHKLLLPTEYGILGTSYDFAEGVGLLGVTDEDTEPTTDYYATDSASDWHTYPDADFFDLRGNTLYLDGHVKFTHFDRTMSWAE